MGVGANGFHLSPAPDPVGVGSKRVLGSVTPQSLPMVGSEYFFKSLCSLTLLLMLTGSLVFIAIIGIITISHIILIMVHFSVLYILQCSQRILTRTMSSQNGLLDDTK